MSWKIGNNKDLKTVCQIRLSLLALNFLVINCLLQFKVPLCFCNLYVIDIASSKTLFFRNSFLQSHNTWPDHYWPLSRQPESYGHLPKDPNDIFSDWSGSKVHKMDALQQKQPAVSKTYRQCTDACSQISQVLTLHDHLDLVSEIWVLAPKSWHKWSDVLSIRSDLMDKKDEVQWGPVQ